MEVTVFSAVEPVDGSFEESSQSMSKRVSELGASSSWSAKFFRSCSLHWRVEAAGFA